MVDPAAPASRGSAIDLAREPDFALGGLSIRPSIREVRGAGWHESIEPRVMQALVALTAADGNVVSRDALLQQCWGGRIVGEDAINNCIAKVRLLLQRDEQHAATLETVPRVGYRLVRADAPEPPSPAARRSLPLPDKPSIAVLPFQDLSGGKNQEYFADAITEDIVTALSRWRWFFVIARDSSHIYRDQPVDLHQVGQELGVRYVIEGSVRKLGPRVRTTAQLVDAATSTRLWSENFEREIVDIFALQDEITERVVNAIEPELVLQEGARAGRKDHRDLNAFDCYQRGMWHMNKVSLAGYREALSLFRQAIARDADLSLGYIGLARLLYGGVTYGWTSSVEQDLQDAQEAARKAIELDPRDAYGHFALSGALLHLAQHGEALDEAEKAVTLNPNFAFGHFRYGQVLTYSGRPTDAIAPIERSMRHSPYDPQLGAMLGALALAHYQARDYAAAERQARAAAGLKNARAIMVLAASLARMGRLAEAQTALADAIRARAERAERSTARPIPYANPADLQHLREGLALADPAGTLTQNV